MLWTEMQLNSNTASYSLKLAVASYALFAESLYYIIFNFCLLFILCYFVHPAAISYPIVAYICNIHIYMPHSLSV